jgi:hypothetical protein
MTVYPSKDQVEGLNPQSSNNKRSIQRSRDASPTSSESGDKESSVVQHDEAETIASNAYDNSTVLADFKFDNRAVVYEDVLNQKICIKYKHENFMYKNSPSSFNSITIAKAPILSMRYSAPVDKAHRDSFYVSHLESDENDIQGSSVPFLFLFKEREFRPGISESSIITMHPTNTIDLGTHGSVVLEIVHRGKPIRCKILIGVMKGHRYDLVLGLAVIASHYTDVLLDLLSFQLQQPSITSVSSISMMPAPTAEAYQNESPTMPSPTQSVEMEDGDNHYHDDESHSLAETTVYNAIPVQLPRSSTSSTN